MVKSVFELQHGSYRRGGFERSYQTTRVMTRVFLSRDQSQKRPYIAGFATIDPLTDKFLLHSREWARNVWNDRTPQTWLRLNAGIPELVAECETLPDLQTAMAKFECRIRRKTWYEQLPEMSRHYSRVSGVIKPDIDAKKIIASSTACFEPSAP